MMMGVLVGVVGVLGVVVGVAHHCTAPLRTLQIIRERVSLGGAGVSTETTPSGPLSKPCLA